MTYIKLLQLILKFGTLREETSFRKVPAGNKFEQDYCGKNVFEL